MTEAFDSDICIDYLAGVGAAINAIDSCDDPIVSIITWIEVLVGAPSPEGERTAREFMATLTVERLRDDVAERAVELRRSHRLKLPDAVIWATALTRGCRLVTRNTRDFPESDATIRVPYRL